MIHSDMPTSSSLSDVEFNLSNNSFSQKSEDTFSVERPHSEPTLLRFSVKCETLFGEAVYVAGNLDELGKWQPQKALKLQWTYNNFWVGDIIIQDKPVTLEFKYIRAQYEQPPTSSNTTWQAGEYNRKLNISKTSPSTIYIQDAWDRDRVTLYLIVKEEGEYKVVGSIVQLGEWRNPCPMKLVQRQRIYSLGIMGPSTSLQVQEYLYSYSFSLPRSNLTFNYLYIQESPTSKTDRFPGRMFSFTQDHQFSNRILVNYFAGQILIFDVGIYDELVFSKITPHILVGGYPKNLQDISLLKRANVTHILSIQSERDYKSHHLTAYYMNLLCGENGIGYTNLAIEDMNMVEFVGKAENALQIMHSVLNCGKGVLYVHCSAGIYRSPQIVALYLHLFRGLKLNEAVRIVQSNHPYARVKHGVIQLVIDGIEKRKGQDETVEV